MEKKTKLETIVKTETVEVCVCSDGRSFGSNHKDRAEKYQRLLNIKDEAKSHLIFKKTEDYELVHCDNSEYIEAYHTDKYTDVNINGKSESGWYFYEFDTYNDSRNYYIFTPVEELFKQVFDIKRVIEESEISD